MQIFRLSERKKPKSFLVSEFKTGRRSRRRGSEADIRMKKGASPSLLASADIDSSNHFFYSQEDKKKISAEFDKLF
jgi:hypothetical protein